MILISIYDISRQRLNIVNQQGRSTIKEGSQEDPFFLLLPILARTSWLKWKMTMRVVNY